MKWCNRETRSLVGLSYLGQYHLATHNLYVNYVLSDPFLFRQEEVISVLRDIIGEDLWGISGRAMLKSSHMRVLAALSPATGEDRSVLDDVVSALYWRECLLAMYGRVPGMLTPLRKDKANPRHLVETHTFSQGSLVFHSWWELQATRYAFWSTIGQQHPAFQEAIRRLPEGIDPLPMFDGEFNLNSIEDFSTAIIDHTNTHPAYDWLPESIYSHIDHERGIYRTSGGFFTLDPNTPREFVSFPTHCTNLRFAESETLDPSYLGLAGYYKSGEGIDLAFKDTELISYDLEGIPVSGFLKTDDLPVVRVSSVDDLEFSEDKIIQYQLPSTILAKDVL